MNIFFISLMAGFILDKIFGDPYNIPHPVCFIGNLISKIEKKLEKDFFKKFKIDQENYENLQESNILSKTDICKVQAMRRKKYLQGLFLALAVVLVTMVVVTLILIAAISIDRLFGLNFKEYGIFTTLISSIMAYQILAMKSLKKEAMKVYRALTAEKETNLKRDNLELNSKEETERILHARRAVSMIVGRDTQNLNEEEIIKATVETVAENTSDGVIAPMIYYALGGGILAFGYKAINTLDSMVGYKNKKYCDLGRFSAKLDDFANYIPARVTGILMVLASGILGFDMKNSWKTFKRDRLNHTSPNSGQSEAACAGALKIQLGGDSMYFGKKYEKATIGDSIKKIEAQDIKNSIKLMEWTSYLQIFIIFIIFTIKNIMFT